MEEDCLPLLIMQNEIACWIGDEIAAGREVGDEKIFLMKVLSRGILGI